MASRAVDAVDARDRTILAFLKDGPASMEAVRAAVPIKVGWTAAQHLEACTLALRRLQLTKLIVDVGDTWMLPG